MVKPPKPNVAAEQIARTNPSLVFGHHCLATDPAVGFFEPSEFFLQQDKPTQNKMLAVRLEAEANVHQAVAAANLKMAGLLKSNG
jgi:hypothetical protein